MADLARPRFANSYLDDVAAALVAAAPDAAQYIEQAPALVVLACAKLGSHITYGELDSFAAAVHARPKLRDLMALFGAPQPLRHIPASALKPQDRGVLAQLARLAPSTLAQVLATDSQRVWLDALHLWMRLLPRKHAEQRSFSLDWISRQLTQDMSRYEMVDGLVDAIGRGGLVINPRWTWQKALDEVAEWHRRINDRRAMERALKNAEIARTFDDVICKAPLPNEAEFNGYSFAVLRTVRRLREEGQAMHHCVASYARDVKAGVSAIISVKRDGVALATLDAGGGQVRQLKAHCNAAVSPEVRNACTMYLLRYWRPAEVAT